MDINTMLAATGKVVEEDGSVTDAVGMLAQAFGVQPIPGMKVDPNAFLPRTGRVFDEDGNVYNIMDFLRAIIAGGGTGGTTNYNLLSNRPQINDVTLQGNLNAEQLGLASAEDVLGLLNKLAGKSDVYPVDMTARPVPQGFPRTWRWVIGASGTVQGQYNYMRAFYKTLDAAIADDNTSPELAGVWHIAGKLMQFQRNDGSSPVLITDNAGQVVTPEYRPIPEGETWFMGDKHPLDGLMPTTPFPTDDVFFSKIEWDIQLIHYLIGEIQELDFPTITHAIKDMLNRIDLLNTVIAEFKDLTNGQFSALWAQINAIQALGKKVGIYATESDLPPDTAHPDATGATANDWAFVSDEAAIYLIDSIDDSGVITWKFGFAFETAPAQMLFSTVPFDENTLQPGQVGGVYDDA